MKEKLISCIIGYFLGCFLTAELVAKKYAGKSCSEIDSGNPGMANIMINLGFVPGIITLVGDVAKCLIAMFLARYLFPETDRNIMFYAGFVATNCIMMLVYSFVWGLVADLAGAIVVLLTKYLNLAGPFPPLVFAAIMFAVKDYEVAVMSLIIGILALTKHWSFIVGIKDGTTEQTDVLGAIKKKLSKKKA